MDKEKLAKQAITFRPITESDDDIRFLFQVFASTRAEEMAVTGWSKEQVDQFLGMQFNLQHTQYMRNYKNPTFDIILYNEAQAGRLYIDRGKKEIRIVDLALLPEFRSRGIGTKILNALITEADSKNLALGLHVEHNNPAMSLYKRLGFIQKGDTGVYLFMEKSPSTANESPG
jgi:ribosomal protein S18 acetylase RimI-like enzyme